MKKILPLLFVLAGTGAVSAQTCVRDSSVLMTGALLSPPFWDTTYMLYALNDACLTHPYTQSVTINVPTTYQGFTLTSVQIATSNAITDLPAGLTYLCDPPNCVFNAATLGCILLYGTPSNTNTAPDTFDLGITTKIYTAELPNFPIPLTFPGQLPGNNHYYLALKDAQCLVGTYDHNSLIGSVKTAPNPFSNETVITVEALTTGAFQFEVFDMLGQRLHSRNIRLEEGLNEIRFDGSNLANGSYFYTIGNQDGKISRKLMVAR